MSSRSSDDPSYHHRHPSRSKSRSRYDSDLQREDQGREFKAEYLARKKERRRQQERDRERAEAEYYDDARYRRRPRPSRGDGPEYEEGRGSPDASDVSSAEDDDRGGYSSGYTSAGGRRHSHRDAHGHHRPRYSPFASHAHSHPFYIYRSRSHSRPGDVSDDEGSDSSRTGSAVYPPPPDPRCPPYGPPLAYGYPPPPGRMPRPPPGPMPGPPPDSTQGPAPGPMPGVMPGSMPESIPPMPPPMPGPSGSAVPPWTGPPPPPPQGPPPPQAAAAADYYNDFDHASSEISSETEDLAYGDAFEGDFGGRQGEYSGRYGPQYRPGYGPEYGGAGHGPSQVTAPPPGRPIPAPVSPADASRYWRPVAPPVTDMAAPQGSPGPIYAPPGPVAAAPAPPPGPRYGMGQGPGQPYSRPLPGTLNPPLGYGYGQPPLPPPPQPQSQQSPSQPPTWQVSPPQPPRPQPEPPKSQEPPQSAGRSNGTYLSVSQDSGPSAQQQYEPSPSLRPRQQSNSARRSSMPAPAHNNKRPQSSNSDTNKGKGDNTTRPRSKSAVGAKPDQPVHIVHMTPANAGNGNNHLTVPGEFPDAPQGLSGDGGGGRVPQASPLLQSYRGTYQTISPMPLTVRDEDEDDGDMSDMDPLDSGYRGDGVDGSGENNRGRGRRKTVSTPMSDRDERIVDGGRSGRSTGPSLLTIDELRRGGRRSKSLVADRRSGRETRSKSRTRAPSQSRTMNVVRAPSRTRSRSRPRGRGHGFEQGYFVDNDGFEVGDRPLTISQLCSVLHSALLHPVDVRPLLKTLPYLTPVELAELRAEYKRQYVVVGSGSNGEGGGRGVNLAKQIKMSVPRYMGRACYSTALGPWESEAYWANVYYQSGLSRRELLIESLVGRSNNEIRQIKAAFRDSRYGNDMERCMQAELPADKFRRLILMVLEARREPNTVRAEPWRVNEDVHDLHKAVLNRRETPMMDILLSQNNANIRAIILCYREHYGTDFRDDLLQRSPNLIGEALTHLINGALDRPLRDAKLLNQAINEAEPGKERVDLLISRLVRMHWNPPHLERVKRAYMRRQGMSVETALKGLIADADPGKSTDWMQFCLQLAVSSTWHAEREPEAVRSGRRS